MREPRSQARMQGHIKPDGTLRSETGVVGGMVERARSATSAITLTGGVAVASVLASCALVVLAAVWLYRRHAGLDKPHTQFVAKRAGAAPLAEQGE
jgi:hypothetical protein